MTVPSPHRRVPCSHPVSSPAARPRIPGAGCGRFGADFAFVARQKRITIDDEDYDIDLLFYHRGLRRLVVVELRLDEFRAADKDRMEVYLRRLDKHERRPGEEAPLGLILCADKSDEHVALLQLDRSGIRVAAYLTELPPKKLLERELHESARRARAQLEGRGSEP